jgi:hypothetical protein
VTWYRWVILWWLNGDLMGFTRPGYD